MKTYLTGIKASGMPHLGNYLGAIKPAIDFAKEKKEGERYLYFIADYHGLTTSRKAKDFSEDVYHVAATWLALGLNTDHAIFYKQSDIPEIFELAWILACHTPKGDLNRAHSYKALRQLNIDNGKKDLDHGVNAGLFNYPTLMASDILLFDTNVVPVGKDQVQHIEISRSIAQRINQNYGETLIEPLESLSSAGQYIPGLDGRKMSKSYGNDIPLFVPEKRLKKLINRIKTDSKEPDEPKSTEDSLIFEIYTCFSSKEEQMELARKYQQGISWGEAKAILFEKVNSVLSEPREKFNYLLDNKQVIEKELKKGQERARDIARDVMKRVRKNITNF